MHAGRPSRVSSALPLRKPRTCANTTPGGGSASTSAAVVPIALAEIRRGPTGFGGGGEGEGFGGGGEGDGWGGGGEGGSGGGGGEGGGGDASRKEPFGVRKVIQLPPPASLPLGFTPTTVTLYWVSWTRPWKVTFVAVLSICRVQPEHVPLFILKMYCAAREGMGGSVHLIRAHTFVICFLSRMSHSASSPL